MARSVTSLAARWLVHSLAHELAASPEATKGAGEGRRLHEREAVYEALPLALQRLLCYELTK